MTKATRSAGPEPTVPDAGCGGVYRTGGCGRATCVCICVCVCVFLFLPIVNPNQTKVKPSETHTQTHKHSTHRHRYSGILYILQGRDMYSNYFFFCSCCCCCSIPTINVNLIKFSKKVHKPETKPKTRKNIQND